MRELTLQVLDLALRQGRAWERAGQPLSIAVNISIANLLDVCFPDDVARLLDKWESKPARLQLEITENTFMADPERALDVLARLGEMGVGLSLDDYGTGFSSLTHLKRIPVQELKIDKSFVMSMTVDREDMIIVQSTIELARKLGPRVVAEGVETPDIWNMLSASGCDVAQGTT